MKEDRTALRRLPGDEGSEQRELFEGKKSRLDEEMVEDADSRHEQFVDERERWVDPEV